MYDINKHVHGLNKDIYDEQSGKDNYVHGSNNEEDEGHINDHPITKT